MANPSAAITEQLQFFQLDEVVQEQEQKNEALASQINTLESEADLKNIEVVDLTQTVKNITDFEDILSDLINNF